MINKQSIWFLTLFGLVLVLGIYYITMPNEFLKNTKEVNLIKDNNIDIKESDILALLRVERDEETLTAMEELEGILTSDDATADEKNLAFEELKVLNLVKGKEASLEDKIKSEFNIKSFIKIENDNISVTINSSVHDYELANKIMRSIQSEYDEKVYISVKFDGN